MYCYIEGSILIIAALLMIKYVALTSLISGIFVIVAGNIVLILAPVENKNKPLDNLERIIYGRPAKIIVVVEMSMILIARILDSQAISSSSIAVAIYFMAGMLVVGKVSK